MDGTFDDLAKAKAERDSASFTPAPAPKPYFKNQVVLEKATKRKGYITRITDAGYFVTFGQDISAMVCWFSDTSLKQSGKYLLRHTSREVKALVKAVDYKVNINTLHKVEDDLELREPHRGHAPRYAVPDRAIVGGVSTPTLLTRAEQKA